MKREESVCCGEDRGLASYYRHNIHMSALCSPHQDIYVIAVSQPIKVRSFISFDIHDESIEHKKHNQIDSFSP